MSRINLTRNAMTGDRDRQNRFPNSLTGGLLEIELIASFTISAGQDVRHSLVVLAIGCLCRVLTNIALEEVRP